MAGGDAVAALVNRWQNVAFFFGDVVEAENLLEGKVGDAKSLKAALKVEFLDGF